MSDKHFEKSTYNPDKVIAHCRGGKELDFDEMIKELNNLEDIRKRKNKQINEFRNRETLYQDVIYGIEAYFRLKYMVGEYHE